MFQALQLLAEYEVGALMGLLEYYLGRELDNFRREGIRLRTIGRTQDLPAGVQARLREAEAETRHLTGYTLVLALNYGSRTEVAIWHALQAAVREPVAVYATTSSGGAFNVRVAIRQRVPGEAREASRSRFSGLMKRFL